MPVSKGPDEYLTSAKNSAILKGRNAAEAQSSAIEVDAKVPHSDSMVHFLLTRRTKLDTKLLPFTPSSNTPFVFCTTQDFKTTMI